MDLNTTLEIKTILDSENVAELLDDEELSLLGSEVCRGFDEDRNSRSDWETRTAEANKLAMQVMEEKNYPWPGSSNVKFPLITISALQYHARAYPATIPGFDVVACRVIGDDPDGKKQQRADRVSAHMSYQRMEEDTQWEESHDKVLLIQSIVGCAFKKQYFDPVEGIQVSELVLPDDLVVNYYTKSLDS
ncbi:MAG: co-chaperone GroES, partial [Nitrososphaerales archaeon]